jgi:hypothetical protein
LAHGDHGLDGASGAAGKDGIRRFAKLLQLGQCPVNARAGCQGSGHGVKKEIAGSPFSLFSFAYLAYFAVSSGALGSSLPAATGGGFGFGKFRRDNQPSLRYGSAEQGSLVQKLGDWVHLIRPVAALTRRCAPPSPIRWARDIAQVKRPDCFIGRRFRFFFQNVIFHSHFSHFQTVRRCYACGSGPATIFKRKREWRAMAQPVPNFFHSVPPTRHRRLSSDHTGRTDFNPWGFGGRPVSPVFHPVFAPKRDSRV